MKWLFCAILNFIIFYVAAAQTPQLLKGRVINRITEEAVPYATVSVAGFDINTICDANGNFRLVITADTTIEIVVMAANFHTTVIPVKGKQPFIEVELEPQQKNLQEVVVSGTLKEVEKTNSPIVVESYSGKFFKKNASSNLFEALSNINGVQPQLNCNVCNTGDIHINGMEGPYTMVLIDGMPVVSNLATVYGFSGIPAGLIKRVEIVKGPSSTLYGSEAVAGVINIVTKDAVAAPILYTDIYTTSYNELNTDVSFKMKTGKSNALFGFNLFGFNKRFDVNSDGFTDVTLQNRVSAFNKWNFSRKSKQPFGFAIRLFHENRWGGQLNWNSKWRGSDSIYGETITTKRVELMGNYGIKAGKEQLLLEYSYNYHNQQSYYGTVPYFAKQHGAFVQLRWNKEIKHHTITTGIPFRYTWYDDNTVATKKPDTNVNLPSINFLKGLFIQDEARLSEKVTLLAGVRYELTDLHGAILSPRTALRWKLRENHLLRLSAGNGFRVVNLFTEDHAALSGAREVVIAEKLKPERSWNANLNYSGTFTQKAGYFTVDATLFYTYFSNKILPDYDSDPQKIIYNNINGYAVSRGFSVNTDYYYQNRLKLLAGITIMDIFTSRKQETGLQQKERQLFAPVFSGNYAISYSFSKAKLFLDLTGKVFGPQRLPVVPNDFRPEYAPWFALANLQVTKKLGKMFEFYIGIKNLFNFIPANPILRPEDPFDKNVNDPVNNPYGYTFDPSYNYAPVMERRLAAGLRFTVN